MSENDTIDRRTILRGAGALAVTGMLAGCGGDGGDGGGSDGDDGSGGGVPDEVDSYLSDANNYDGSVEDATGQDEVTVSVGAGDGLAFGPAAVRVDTGTTVVWEWTGAGGNHNVVAEDDTFRSGDPVPEGPYEYTFEEAGNYNYYCAPHKQSGMKAAIIVE